MPKKPQSTQLYRSFDNALDRLELWAFNPWRRYSLLTIVLLIGFFLGSSVGTINGVLALMDPVAALLTVLILELMVRLRKNGALNRANSLLLKIIDNIFFLYFLLEFKF